MQRKTKDADHPKENSQRYLLRKKTQNIYTFIIQADENTTSINYSPNFIDINNPK